MSVLHRMNRHAVLGAPALKGLSPDESLIVREYVQYHCNPLDMFSIALPIGPGDTSTPSVSAAIDRMWARITRRKIDCIVWRSSHVRLIEAKVHARMPAVTQLLRYVELFAAEYPSVPLIVPYLICRTCDFGVQRRLEQAGAELVLMPVRAWPAEAC